MSLYQVRSDENPRTAGAPSAITNNLSLVASLLAVGEAVTITISNSCPSPYSVITPTQGDALIIYGASSGWPYSYSGCVPCTASTNSADDGSDGIFYCINSGTVGGTTSSCTCTSCATGYSGDHCEIADSCSASTDSDKDGSDGVFYCIHGGTIRGTTGSCTCTNCYGGYSGNSCQTAGSCTASTSPSADGSEGIFYCVNGGDIGGTTGSCACASCNTGYSGNSCQTAGSCVATSTFTDDGSDGNFYCVNSGTVGGTTGSCTCSCKEGAAHYGVNCANMDRLVTGMSGLHSHVSNYNAEGFNTGTSIITSGDAVVMAAGSYKCPHAGAFSSDNCAAADTMLMIDNLWGTIKCTNDKESTCVIDGETTRRIVNIEGTGYGTLLLRALTFKNGFNQFRGGEKLDEERRTAGAKAASYVMPLYTISQPPLLIASLLAP